MLIFNNFLLFLCKKFNARKAYVKPIKIFVFLDSHWYFISIMHWISCSCFNTIYTQN